MNPPSQIPQPVMERWPLADMLPLPGNEKSRKVTKAGLELLGASMEQFGNLLPITVNRRSKHIMAGNQRHKVLLAKKETHTDVWVVDIDPFYEQFLALALNRHAAAFDGAKLSDLVFSVMQQGGNKELFGLTMLPAAQVTTLLGKYDKKVRSAAELATSVLGDDQTVLPPGHPPTFGQAPDAPQQPKTIKVNIHTGVKAPPAAKPARVQTFQYKLGFNSAEDCVDFKTLVFDLRNGGQYEGLDTWQVILSALGAKGYQ